MIKIYASIFVVLLNICFVLSHVITIEVKGRLLCNGKEHGKVGLDGWPKKVYLWDMTDDGEFEIPLFLIYNICRYSFADILNSSYVSFLALKSHY